MSGAVNGSRAGFETARLKLARLRLDGEDARQTAMRQLARVSAHALQVERVSVWLYEDDGRLLRNIDQYQLSSDTHVAGELLKVDGYAGYQAALNERRVLAVADARNHVVVRELTGTALALDGTVSRLDAPIIREGTVAGIVCYEHVGEARPWSQKDRDFAASSADMAALFLEQADRVEIEVALRQRREERLAEEKMAALGRLARSVAHDMSNVFNALSMTGHLLETREAEDLRRQGDSINRAVGLGVRLVEQLTLFGDEAAEIGAPVDLAFLLARMQPLLLELMRGARLEITVSCAAPTVHANASQIEQVLLNLCVNAAEAVASTPHGLVRIELRDTRPEEPLDPTSLVLSVEDNGHGMDAETQAHIFEPYFTRKAGGHGIGLSVVYGIVKRCSGTISVHSEPGAGATFTIALPRAPSPRPLR
jgi:signal transduction histidine kinase